MCLLEWVVGVEASIGGGGDVTVKAVFVTARCRGQFSPNMHVTSWPRCGPTHNLAISIRWFRT